MPKTIDPDVRRKAILSRYAAGMSYKQIAAILSVSYSTIAQFVRSHGMNRMVRKPSARKERKPRVRAVDRVTPEQCETIVEMAGRAETYRAIREATGLGEHVINEVLKREGLWPKPCRYDLDDDYDPPWWPDPNDPLPDYGDEFVLKPEHRARLEEVRYRRRIGRPIVQRQFKTERTRHD